MVENFHTRRYIAEMRSLLPLMMIIALAVGAMIQSHGPTSSVRSADNGHHTHIAMTNVKCCEKAVVGDLESNCAVDCHYLPALIAPPTSPALASLGTPSLSESVRDLAYLHMKPPISI